jgi:uncharacterized membrane protein YtjA (UPF0391 family)
VLLVGSRQPRRNQFHCPKLDQRIFCKAAGRGVGKGARDDNSEMGAVLVSIVAGLLGFTGISVASADIARFLFYVFAGIFLVLLILGLTIFRV